MARKTDYPPHPAIVEHPDGSFSTFSKRCRGCRVTKMLDEFHARGSAADGRETRCKTCSTEKRRKRWREADTDKERENNRRWREANADRERERARRRWAENTEREQERNRLMREANRNRTDTEIAERRAELRPDGIKRCLAGHEAPLSDFSTSRSAPDGLKYTCKAHDNLALLKTVIGRWEDLDLWRCTYCDAPFEDVEHVIPASRADEFGIDNADHPEGLTPSCKACNRGPGGKFAQTPAEWRPDEHYAIYQTVMLIRRLRGECDGS